MGLTSQALTTEAEAFHLTRGYSESLAAPITAYLRDNNLLGDAP